MSIPTKHLLGAWLLAGLASASAATPATPAARKPAAEPLRTYIVQLHTPAAANYAGGLPGLPATRVADGQRFDARQAAVQAYRARLSREQDAVLALLGPKARAQQRFSLGFNGFTARLTSSQVRQLQASGRIRLAVPDVPRRVATVSTPSFLGLDGPGGLWTKQRRGQALQGEDIIIAAIDSGVQPENPSFYDHVDANGTPVASGGTLAYGPPPAHWKGSCTTGPGFPATSCNNKLIGARVFNTGWLSSGLLPWFGTFSDSPRDEDGHGSHTLATAGGNADAPARDARGVDVGLSSGMAPRARLVAYKALFRASLQAGVQSIGMSSDLIAAIEAAIADGVDVINFSVSGDPNTLVDPIELAFLGASSANIFVAAAAGNAGMPYTVGHPAPWLTTVAASSHDRNPYARLLLGNGTELSGSSFNATALSARPMVLGQDIGAAGVPAARANWCAPNTLDPAKAAGRIVVCDRGGIVTRVDKSSEVMRAGGVGMVLLNVTESDLETDWHLIPTVQMPAADREAVRAYAATTGAVASIGTRYQVPGLVAPVMTYFSSIGPNAADDTLLKPDVTAPGLDIIASFAQQQRTQSENYAIRAGTLAPTPVVASLAGTSMAAPHVAGVAALLKQAHPSWSPAAIKSALMTTTSAVRLADGSPDPNGTGYGAGHVDPNAAFNPGLVYPATQADYVRFLCAAGWYEASAPDCAGVGPRARADLNQPSIAGTVAGQSSVHRRVRNEGKRSATYVASANLPGFDVSVNPGTLTLAPGQVGEFDVTLSRSTAPFASLVSGSLTWTDGAHRVAIPVQATALEVRAAYFLQSAKTTDALSHDVVYGTTGISSAPTGLAPSVAVAGSVPRGTFTCGLDSFTVPEGTSLLRTSINSADIGLGLDEFYLNITSAAGDYYGLTHVEGDDLVLDVKSPPAGDYQMCLWPLYAGPGNVSFTAYRTMLNPKLSAEGGLKVEGLPARSVKLGKSYTATVSWSGLTAGQRYLGTVDYRRPDGSLAGSTIIKVSPGAGTRVRTSAPRGVTPPAVVRQMQSGAATSQRTRTGVR